MPALKPEVWCTSTADAPVVVLTIPGVLERTRVFDVVLAAGLGSHQGAVVISGTGNQG
jgi:hypothetical protein